MERCGRTAPVLRCLSRSKAESFRLLVRPDQFPAWETLVETGQFGWSKGHRQAGKKYIRPVFMLADNPRPEICRDKENHWAEHCETNSDARDKRSGKLPIG
jgi:hypothetical protein